MEGDHIAESVGPKQHEFVCTFCPASYRRKGFLANHVMKLHSLDNLVRTEPKEHEETGRGKRKKLSPACKSNIDSSEVKSKRQKTCDEASQLQESPRVSNEDQNVATDISPIINSGKRKVGRPRKVVKTLSVENGGTCEDGQNHTFSSATSTNDNVDIVNETTFPTTLTVKRRSERSKRKINCSSEAISTDIKVKFEDFGEDLGRTLTNNDPNMISNLQSEDIIDNVNLVNNSARLNSVKRERSSRKNKKMLNNATVSVGVKEENTNVQNEEIHIRTTNDIHLTTLNDLDNGLPIKKKRGRPKKSNIINNTCASTTVNELSNDAITTNEDETQNKRRPGRPRKFTLNLINAELPRGRGRPKLQDIAQLKNQASITKQQLGSVKCSCLKEFSSEKEFTDHVFRTHNGLARRLGDERPFNVHEKRLILIRCAKLLKRLRCLQTDCTKSFSTVLGYLYHENICGTNTSERMVTCTICGKNLVEASVKSHNKAFHEKKPVPLVKDKSDDNDGLKKRKAAKKAVENLSKLTNEEKPDDRGKDEDYKSGSDSDTSSEENELSGDEGMKTERTRVSTKPPPNEEDLMNTWKKEILNSGSAWCKNEGCCQVEASLGDIMRHFHKCRYRQHDVYECTNCKLRSGKKETVDSHIQQDHVNELDSGGNPIIYPKLIPCTLKIGTAGSKEDHREHRKSYRHFISYVRRHSNQQVNSTQKFLKHNHSDDNNFADWLPLSSHWSKLLPNEQEDVLPILKSSIEFKMTTARTKKLDINSDPWSKLNLFQSMNTEGPQNFKTCFAGGPIKALAWCPTPPNCQSRQYIALYCHRDSNNEAVCKYVFSGSVIIQIWDLENLESNDSGSAKMVLAIVDNSGAIWNLKWCPSSCYENTDLSLPNVLPRIGLLAAACADGYVKIYSVPRPSSLENVTECLFYKAKPIALLSLIPNTEFVPRTQCTSLSWFEGKGHHLMAAGYSDGLISVWDLKSKSPMICVEEEDHVKNIISFKCFRGHGNIVTGVDFCPLHNGRFLVSCSRDRCLKYWNLDDVSLPINSIGKRSITAVTWIPNWCGAFAVSENCFSLHYNGMVFMESNYAGEITGSAITHRGSTLDISVSNWFKCVVTCDDGGEVMMGAISHAAKLINYKRMLLYRSTLEENPDLNVTKNDGDVSNDESENSIFDVDKCRSYENAARRFKVVYKDLPLNRISSMSKEELIQLCSVNSMGMTQMDYYPLNSVNKVAWNPNLGTHQWLATGEQSGILRFIQVSALDYLNVNKIRQELNSVMKNDS